MGFAKYWPCLEVNICMPIIALHVFCHIITRIIPGLEIWKFYDGWYGWWYGKSIYDRHRSLRFSLSYDWFSFFFHLVITQKFHIITLKRTVLEMILINYVLICILYLINHFNTRFTNSCFAGSTGSLIKSFPEN